MNELVQKYSDFMISIAKNEEHDAIKRDLALKFAQYISRLYRDSRLKGEKLLEIIKSHHVGTAFNAPANYCGHQDSLPNRMAYAYYALELYMHFSNFYNNR